MTQVPPNSLFLGRVRHERLQPFRHAFGYPMLLLWLDLDRLGEADRVSRLLAVDRRAPMSVQARDHGPRDGSALKPWVQGCLEAAGIGADAGASVRLLTMPRVLGYVFNPLSVYYCYDARDRLAALVYEVRNTFGDWHWYVLAAAPDASGRVTHGCAKRFHVSPFMPMRGDYAFTVAPPGERLGLTITYTVDGARHFVAALSARRRPLTPGQLARALLRQPWVTVGAKASIYGQALRLWRRGARFHRRPAPPAQPVSAGSASEPVPIAGATREAGWQEAS